MTNSTTTTMQSANHSYARGERKASDAAPMVITRLSGWINTSEIKSEMRAWIIPTRIHAHSR